MGGDNYQHFISSRGFTFLKDAEVFKTFYSYSFLRFLLTSLCHCGLL